MWRVYCALPPFAQNLAVSVAGWAKHRSEYAAAYRRLLPGFLETQYAPPQALEELQLERLRRLLIHASKHVPYYKKLFAEIGFVPERIGSVAEIKAIPLLTKEIVRAHYQKLISDDHRRRKTYIEVTSGTTGTSLRLLQDRATLLHEKAWIARHRLFHGLVLGKSWRGTLNNTIVMPLHKKKPPFWRVNRSGRQVIFSTLHLSEENAGLYLRKLREAKIEYLEGHPSMIYPLARAANILGQRVPLKGVFIGAEPLFDFQRIAIQNAFQCRVFNYYGLAEKNLSAGDCEAGEQLHVNAEDVIAEVLDPETLEPISEPEKPGLLIGTSLVNYSMPMIRYDTGDTGSWAGGRCPCGRTLPRMNPVFSKLKNLIKTPSGRWISGSAITVPIKKSKGIIESQIVQTDPDRLVVKVIPAPEFDRTEKERLETMLLDYIGDEMALEIVEVDRIPRMPSGKFLYVYSEVDHGIPTMS
jgi:phenylacetate-CoA ligase